ncbi:Hypothetical predicted protein [Octopus vulgaris]|uniref:Uncharacterized protein n=1 Tax=Octopus vulgaris TaxID=6645 RepID=A0AA36FBZ2_OCTVU|nr:Hypothetical predicted protein [Octopus vulgaris]
MQNNLPKILSFSQTIFNSFINILLLQHHCYTGILYQDICLVTYCNNNGLGNAEYKSKQPKLLLNSYKEQYRDVAVLSHTLTSTKEQISNLKIILNSSTNQK